jgi:hypothetical protein
VVGLVVVALTIIATGGCGAFGGAPEASRAEMIVLGDVTPSGLAVADQQPRPVVDVVEIDTGPGGMSAPAVPASAGGVGWVRGLLGGAAGVALGGGWQAGRARLLGAPRRRTGDRTRWYRLAACALVVAAVVGLLAACSGDRGAGGGGAPTDGGTAAPGGVAAPTGVPPAAAPGTPGAAAPIGAPIVTSGPRTADPPA